ncbi:MAG TPA: hydroxymethylbilane synthase [bacterium]|nr:hydroxymethylbilane synthase [bacterium]
MSPERLILGTRGSALAWAQSSAFAAALEARHPGLKVELKKILTSGDRIQDRFLSEVGGKGLFVKEIEEGLLREEVDLAVHSLKDVPAELAPGLEIAIYPQRLDSEDVLIAASRKSLAELPPRARVGTSSLRRRLQLARLRPDLSFELLRGNIDTRLRKLDEGAFDAIVLAKAGLRRLGVDLSRAVDLPIVAAPGQGTLAIEARAGDRRVKDLLAPLHHGPTETVSLAERRVMKALGGGCHLPLGVYGEIRGDRMKLKAFLAEPDGSRWVEEEVDGAAAEWDKVADELLRLMEKARGVPLQ